MIHQKGETIRESLEKLDTNIEARRNEFYLNLISVNSKEVCENSNQHHDMDRLEIGNEEPSI